MALTRVLFTGSTALPRSGPPALGAAAPKASAVRLRNILRKDNAVGVVLLACMCLGVEALLARAKTPAAATAASPAGAGGDGGGSAWAGGGGGGDARDGPGSSGSFPYGFVPLLLLVAAAARQKERSAREDKVRARRSSLLAWSWRFVCPVKLICGSAWTAHDAWSAAGEEGRVGWRQACPAAKQAQGGARGGRHGAHGA